MDRLLNRVVPAQRPRPASADYPDRRSLRTSRSCRANLQASGSAARAEVRPRSGAFTQDPPCSLELAHSTERITPRRPLDPPVGENARHCHYEGSRQEQDSAHRSLTTNLSTNSPADATGARPGRYKPLPKRRPRCGRLMHRVTHSVRLAPSSLNSSQRCRQKPPCAGSDRSSGSCRQLPKRYDMPYPG